MTLASTIRRGARTIIRRSGWDLVRIADDRCVHQFNAEFKVRRLSDAADVYGVFIADDGVRFPLLRGYRYSIKKSWRMIPELFGLETLKNAGKLSPAEVRKFDSFIGESSITAPIGQIADFARPLLMRHESIFEPGTVHAGRRPVARRTDTELRHAIAGLAGSLGSHLSLLPADWTAVRRRILDVGCGRGLSTAAFALMGHDATGVDNDYGAGLEGTGLTGVHCRLRELVGPSLSFRRGDISCCPEIPDESVDLVYSASVLEHVQDIDAAFREMRRVLKPRGAMIHSYNPFWAVNGGHAFGTLDAPWLHAMLSADDHLRYMTELCPFEAPAANPWIANALNRSLTISRMQGAVLRAGFDLRSWQESVDKPRHLATFTPDYLRHVQRHQSDVTLADLLATSIVFVAQRPGD